MTAVSIDAVIFDCDGTLVDSETLSLSVLIDYVSEFGLEITPEEAHDRFAGNELSVVFRDIESRLGHALPDHFLDTFRQRQISLLERQLTAIDGAHDLLDGMDLPFCVASNAPFSKIHVCLRTTGLDVHFSEDRIFSAYQIEVWKPAPDLFLKAARDMGVAPERCAVVEDSGFGIRAGLAAGMQVFAFDPDNRHTEYSGIRRVTHLNQLAACFR
ncbi:MAG: HAD family hydrolase [Planctomycetaceae bacterium]